MCFVGAVAVCFAARGRMTPRTAVAAARILGRFRGSGFRGLGDQGLGV